MNEPTFKDLTISNHVQGDLESMLKIAKARKEVTFCCLLGEESFYRVVNANKYKIEDGQIAYVFKNGEQL